MSRMDALVIAPLQNHLPDLDDEEIQSAVA
jgi:hypothetical protein